jgi:hypothetical protein
MDASISQMRPCTRFLLMHRFKLQLALELGPMLQEAAGARHAGKRYNVMSLSFEV